MIPCVHQMLSFLIGKHPTALSKNNHPIALLLQFPDGCLSVSRRTTAIARYFQMFARRQDKILVLQVQSQNHFAEEKFRVQNSNIPVGNTEQSETIIFAIEHNINTKLTIVGPRSIPSS